MAVGTVCPILLFPVIFLQSILTGCVVPNQQNTQVEIASQFIKCQNVLGTVVGSEGKWLRMERQSL